MMRTNLAMAVVGLMIGASGPASAGILLKEKNLDVQTDSPFVLPFLATASFTTVSIGGYQVAAGEQVTHVGVFLRGTRPNLLGSTWHLTPAAIGSLTHTFSDGTPVPALAFGGTFAGDFDVYSQTIPTMVGRTYTVDFLYSNFTFRLGSGLLVEVGNASVPEPSSLVLAGIAGLIVLGHRARSRRKRALDARVG